MRLREYLNERISNLFKSDQIDKELYAEDVWNILQNSYRKIGGIQGNGFKSIDDMIKNIPMWKIFRRGGDIKVVMMYKDKQGRKRVAIGTDGTLEAKQMLAKMIQDEYKTGRAFGEVSDNSLRFIQKQFTEDEFKKFVIPVDTVKQLLPKDEIVDIDGYFYKREIGGEWHTKLMLGNPKAKHIK